jgi:hypothetical protein
MAMRITQHVHGAAESAASIGVPVDDRAHLALLFGSREALGDPARFRALRAPVSPGDPDGLLDGRRDHGHPVRTTRWW